MNIRSMIYLTTIAKEGNLTAAGKKLGVSQPTLSVFLTKLENELGSELFIHEKKQLIPTPAGKIYLEAAERIIRVKERVYQSIYQLEHKSVETLRVGATHLRGAVMFAKIFYEFNQKFPDIKLEIEEHYMKDLKEMVKENKIHLALGSCYDSDNPDFDYITISKEEIVLCAPEFHPLVRKKQLNDGENLSVDIKELEDTPFILMTKGSTIRTIVDTFFERTKIQPTIVFETNNNLVIKNMIREGAGVGFLPLSAAADEADIVSFSLQPPYYMYLGIIMAKGRIMTEAERYLTYLVIKRDTENTIYTSALNSYAKDICQEFES